MLHTKFRGNQYGGSGKDFLRVFTINRHGCHLGHVISIILINFHSNVPISLHTKFIIWLKMAQWFLRKASFDFHRLMTLGHGQEMTLTFSTHNTSLTQLFVCIYQLSGHRLQ